MNNIIMPLTANLRSLTPSLNTLGPNYSNMPELYSSKRIHAFDKIIEDNLPNQEDNLPNQEDNLPNQEDKLKKYKEYMIIAVNSVNTIYLNSNLEYSISENNMSSYISDLYSSTSLNITDIYLFNIDTNTNVFISSPKNIVYKYDKATGIFTIDNIPNFDKTNTKATATLIAIIDPTLSLNITLEYEPAI
jgi:hypothetical protein